MAYEETPGQAEYTPETWPWSPDGTARGQTYPVFPKGRYADGGDFGPTPRPLYVDEDGNLFVYEKDGFFPDTAVAQGYGKAPAPVSSVTSYMGWPTAEEISALWDQAPDDDATLELIRSAAIAQCEAFAPNPPGSSSTAWQEDPNSPGLFFMGNETPPVVTIPANWRLALIMQVKNLWNASLIGPSGSTSEGDLGMTPFPLTWQVKALLRPKRGRPLVG